MFSSALPVLSLALLIFVALLIIYAIKKCDLRIPTGFALIILVVSAFAIVFKNEIIANQIAIYAYQFLFAGVVLQLIEYMADGGE